MFFKRSLFADQKYKPTFDPHFPSDWKIASEVELTARQNY
jgi:hypothetical protein